MPAIRRYIDPSTGDYEVVNGGPKNDNSMASSIVLRLRMQRGSIPGLPSFGSRIHTIPSVNSSGLRMAEQYAIEAIQDLVDRGDIKNPVAVASLSGNVVNLEITYLDINRRTRIVTYSKTVGAA